MHLRITFIIIGKKKSEEDRGIYEWPFCFLLIASGTSSPFIIEAIDFADFVNLKFHLFSV